MKHLVIVVLLLSTIILGHCVSEHEEVEERCPVKCTCGVTEEERIFADCSKQNYTSIPPRFPKLNSLNFSNNQVSEVSKVNFIHESLRDIQNIDLSNNKIQSIETKSFEHLTQLRYLDISSNEIGSLSPESFKKLKKLAVLDLRGNSIHCIALKNELPLVDILCSNSEEYRYDTTTATAALTKVSDINMEISEVSYTDDTVVTTVTKTNLNDTEMQITTNTRNYNNTFFGVTQITHGVSADQQPSTMSPIYEGTSTALKNIGFPVVVLFCVVVVLCCDIMALQI